MKFNKKGQGALEYLLLIGGAVLIAVIVIALLVGMGSTGQKNAQQNADNLGQAVNSVPVAATLISVNGSGTTVTANFTANGGSDANIFVGLINGAMTEYALSEGSATVASLTAGNVYQAYVETTSANQRVRSNTVTFTAE